MIKYKIYFYLFLTIAVLTTRIGGINCSADSGISIGVNIIPIGPPTINDFDYSNLNLSQPVADSGSVKGTASTSNDSAISSDGSESRESVDSTNSNRADLSKDTNSNSVSSIAEQKDDQGIVKSAKSETNPNWFMNLFNRCASFFKNLFNT